MPTFGDLLNWNGSGLRAAAEALLADAQVYNEVGGDLQGLSADDFKGRTAEEEATARRVLVDDAEDIARGLESAGNKLNKAGTQVDSLAERAQSIKDRASAEGILVNDSGPDSSDYDAEVGYLIAAADDTIVNLRPVFGALAALGGVAGGPKPEVLAASSEGRRPDASWTPEEVSDYWAAMSPEQQQHIIENYPQWIGNLDGIPCAVRHKANVNRLPHMEAEAQAELDRTPKKIKRTVDDDSNGGTKTIEVPNPEYYRLERQLKDIRALRMKFDGTGDVPPAEHYLLLLDKPSESDADSTAEFGRLRAAIASGNIDDADHVAVHVPGMNSTVEKSLAGGSSDTVWGGSVRNVDRTVVEARNQLHDVGRGDEEVAAVTWLGYEAPQGLSEAEDDTIATSAAPRLARFCEGVQATHHGDPHLTLDGHSYGSRVAGEAAKLLAKNSSTVIDGISVAGSPGTGFRDASDVNLLPEGDLYATATESGGFLPGGIFGDEVPFSGAHAGRNPHLAQDFTRLEAGTAGDAVTTPSGQQLPPASGHSEHYDWITPQSDSDAVTMNDDGSYELEADTKIRATGDGSAQSQQFTADKKSVHGQAEHTIEGPGGDNYYIPNISEHNIAAIWADTGQEVPHQ